MCLDVLGMSYENDDDTFSECAGCHFRFNRLDKKGMCFRCQEGEDRECLECNETFHISVMHEFEITLMSGEIFQSWNCPNCAALQIRGIYRGKDKKIH